LKTQEEGGHLRGKKKRDQGELFYSEHSPRGKIGGRGGPKTRSVRIFSSATRSSYGRGEGGSEDAEGPYLGEQVENCPRGRKGSRGVKGGEKGSFGGDLSIRKE